MRTNVTMPLIIFAASQLFTYCSSSKPSMAVPEDFTKQATQLSIPGNNPGRKPLQLGDYKTSKIKRGWNLTASRLDRNQHRTMQTRLLRLMGINTEHLTTTEKDKFQFTVERQGSVAEVYALERKVTASTRWKTYSKWLQDYSSLKNAEYLFSAAIITSPDSTEDKWKLEIYGHRDGSGKGDNMIERLQWEEGGYLTDGTDTLIIRSVKIDKVISPGGKEATMPFAVFKAYEFRSGDEVAAIIDTFGNHIWIYNGLDDRTRLLITSSSIAILMRRNAIF